MDGQHWTHVQSVWSGPSGYSSLQVVGTANATVPNLIESDSTSLRGRNAGGSSPAHRVGLLFEAWANFSMRDFPSIRYIDVDVSFGVEGPL